MNALAKIRRIFTPTEQRKAVSMLALVILMALAETAGVISIMPFLSVLGRPAIIEENTALRALYHHFDFTSARAFTVALGLASIAIVVSSAAFKTVTLHLLNRFVHLARHSIGSRLLACYLRQPYAFFLTHNPSLLEKNILSETDLLVFNLIQPLSQLLAQGAVVLAMVVLILCYDPAMALCIVLALSSLYCAIYWLVRKRLERIGNERQEADGQRYQSCNEALGAIKEVKVTRSAAAWVQKFSAASRLFARHMAAAETLAQSPLYIVEATGYTGLVVIALLLLLRTNDVAHVLPALGLYGFAAYRMLPAVQIMYRGFARLKFSMATLDVIHDGLALPDETTAPAAAPLAPRREIRLERICYAYPATPEAPVLRDFDLVIEAGSSVGITGKSGAGKSTLMDILLGLLQPQGGGLRVDGVPVTAENVASWQRAIGYVPQHIYLADASVLENIAFGIPRAEIDRQAVERAARAAQIHDFIDSELPDGYETRLGDRGIRLSGGQRQRIGIARALYASPPVLLLDEATSALDNETERALNDAILKLSGKKTIVIITHRESNLRHCQQIITVQPRAESNASAQTGNGS
jgi:ABC-type multidrug transport system fused ATPase/permease subunit